MASIDPTLETLAPSKLLNYVQKDRLIEFISPTRYADLEQRLRQHSAALGRPASELIREALVAYLDQSASTQPPSAYALGSDLFGRFSGPADLAAGRKSALADAWGGKLARQG